MSVKDFYNAVTPGSSLTHGVGRGVYTILNEDDVCSKNTYENEKLPTAAGWQKIYIYLATQPNIDPDEFEYYSSF